MEDDLKSLLESNGVVLEIRELLRERGCKSIKHFANWVDSKTELAAEVMVKLPGA